MINLQMRNISETLSKNLCFSPIWRKNNQNHI